MFDTMEIPPIEFEYCTSDLVDLRTAREMAYVELAARDEISSLLSLIPDLDAPDWIKDPLTEQTAEITDEVEIIKRDTSGELIRIERKNREIAKANDTLDIFFFQPVYMRHARVLGSMPVVRSLGQVLENELRRPSDERTRQSVQEIQEQIAQVSREVRTNKDAEPQTFALFDNSDSSDMEGGRLGSDVLRAFRGLSNGLDQTDNIQQFNRNQTCTKDGTKSTYAVFSPLIEGGSGAGYMFADYPDRDVLYRIDFESSKDGFKKVSLTISRRPASIYF